MVGGKVGPGLGGMGDSESGLAILLNCENIPPPKKVVTVEGKLLQSAIERDKHVAT